LYQSYVNSLVDSVVDYHTCNFRLRWHFMHNFTFKRFEIRCGMRRSLFSEQNSVA
jgi:hypothetical protein